MRLSVASGVATMAVAITLYPLFNGGAWMWGSLGAVLVVSAVSSLASRVGLPGWLAPPVGLVALFLYLDVVFARQKAWALVVPTKESTRELARLLGVGFADIQRFAAPVPATTGIVLLTTGGVGLIALLVDLLATRSRRAALAGLPLLALFTVPAAVLADPIGWPAFILGALGFTSLLIADGRERVGRWGRAVLVRRARLAPTQATRETADTRGLRLSGKRIGFTAIALAVLVPALLPTLEPNPLFGFGVGGTGGGKGGSISIPNPIANLKGRLRLPANETVLTYTNSDDQPRYLRIYALDKFDGEQWAMTSPTGSPENRVDRGPLPPPPGLAGTPVVRAETKISVSEAISRLQFLPLPYPPGTVRADGDWRADVSSLMVFSTDDEAAGLEYQVVSTEPNPSLSQLRGAGTNSDPAFLQRYLQLPRGVEAEVDKLAFTTVSGAASPYEKALRLQEFFTKSGQFVYSLEAQGHDNAAMSDFLLRSKAGYCEQFASAMALMARIVGIPARVAIGFTGGTKTGQTWQVRTHDSHAWPELYFEGVGWLAFEPTPTGGQGQGTARVPAYSVAQAAVDPGSVGPSAGPGQPATSASGGPANRRGNRFNDREEALGAPIIAEEESMAPAGRIGIGAGALLLVLLVPAGLRLLTRSRRVRVLSWKVAGPSDEVTVRAVRRDATVAAVWAELDDMLYDYGMARDPSETPRSLARRLTQQHEFDTAQGAAITTISAAVERVLFARDPGEIAPLGGELRTLRRALAATVPRLRRLRAALAPPSTLRRIRGLGEGLLDGFDRLGEIRLRRAKRA